MAIKSTSEVGTVFRPRGRKLPWGAIVILGAYIAAGAFAEQLTPYDPTGIDLRNSLQAPSLTHLLGTDNLGRDVLTRLLFGARLNLVVILMALVGGGMIGGAFGMIGGYFGGYVDTIISRAVDAFLAMPALLFGLLLAVMMGPGLAPVGLAIAISLWARFARVIRSEVLTIREMEFVGQARVNGCSQFQILRVHVLPNVVSSAMVLISINLGFAVLVESALSFLGAGIPPPAPSWGGMISEGQSILATAWWVPVAPGVAIVMTVLAFNVMGEWLRDRLDPRLRGSL